MSDDRDDLIRKRAHEIWLSEGSPEGREQAHWQQAEKEIDAESTDRDGISATPVKPAKRKRKAAS